MRVAVAGLGAVGARVARQLSASEGVDGVIVADEDRARADALARTLGEEVLAVPVTSSLGDAEVVVLAGPAGTHADRAAELLGESRHVVSVSDDIDEVTELADQHPMAEARDRTLVIGAGFAPGLSCVLARHAATTFDTVDEIHVARAGTAGPACARQHHRSLGGTAMDWRDGGWLRRAGGSGRELCWFPDPVGGLDCYRAALPDSLLLVNAIGGLSRVTARQAATRRDRFTARLPMLRQPHPEGEVGAIRVEVRGRRSGVRGVEVYGAMDRPGVAAGTVAAVAAVAVGRGGATGPGAGSLAWALAPVPFLADLAHRGVRAATFTGEAADPALYGGCSTA